MSSNINAPVAYISHDVGMRNHRKVRVLRQKFGHMGYAVWCYLLETLAARDGFCLDFDEVEQESLAVDFEVSTEDLKEIVDYCVRIRLLSLVDGRLFSQSLFDRLSGIIEARQKRSDAGRAGALARWQLRDEMDATAMQTDANGCDRNASECDRNATAIQTDANAMRPQCDSMRFDAIQCDSMLSKEKKSKVEKSKVEKSIDNSSSSSACVYERERVCERVREAWDAALGGKLPKLKSLTRNRAELVESALMEIEPDASKWGDLAAELFARVGESSFLLDKGKGWMPTFEWVFESAERVQQILEGQYAESYGPAQPKGVKRQAPQALASVPVYRDADHWSEEHRRGKTFDELSEREQDLLRQLNPGKYPPKEEAAK